MTDAPGKPVLDGIILADGTGFGRLVGGRCRACGTVTFPSAAICPQCWARGTTEAVPLQGRGTLYSYTVVRHAPAGFTAPYSIGCIDLPENLRILAQLPGDLPDGLAPGDPVLLEVGVVATGETGERILGPTFRPLPGGEQR